MPDWIQLPETERIICCDTLLLSVGLIPENELSVKAGVVLDPITGGPVTNEKRETNIPGIFVAGNVVHVNDYVDRVSWDGEIAGQSAAEYVTGKAVPSKRRINLEAGENIRYVMPQSINGEKQVSLQMRVKEPRAKVEIRVGDIMVKRLKAVAPAEMVIIDLTKEELKKISKETEALTINCKAR